MKTKILILVLVVSALFATWVIYRVFHNSQPTVIAIPDATKAWRYHHLDTDFSANNAGLYVAVDGNIEGEAIFNIPGVTNLLHTGPVHMVIKESEYWGSSVVLSYSPSNVTSGNLRVTINIK